MASSSATAARAPRTWVVVGSPGSTVVVACTRASYSPRGQNEEALDLFDRGLRFTSRVSNLGAGCDSLTSQQRQRGLRAGVGLGQDRRRRLAEDLGARQSSRFLSEVGVTDRALGSAGVFERDAKAVDRRADRELLERTEPASQLRDLLDGLVDHFLRGDEVLAVERGRPTAGEAAEITIGAVAKAGG